jgi:hypothetical protein
MPDKSKMTATRILSLITFITILTAPSIGLTATLVWDPSAGVVDGYKVYWGTSSSNPTNNIDVGPRAAYNLDLLPLSEGVTYYISVSAYNSAGESARCAPVVYTLGDNTPPAPPVGLTAE